MPKSTSENVADFLLGFLPDILPKPADSVAKSAVDTFKYQLDALLAEPRLKRELLDAAKQAELNFRTEAPKQLENADLVEAVASFPLFDRDLFQKTLSELPDHLNEEFLADDLQGLIADDWKGIFTPAELREGVAIYLNCLRIQLLKVDGFADIVTRLATLRTDVRTEQILAIVTQLASTVKVLVERLSSSAVTVATALFTIPLPVADFTGRETELAQLKENFSRGALISGVSGGGGIGKTELARKLAQVIADDFPDARLNIDLLGTLETPLTPEEVMRRLLEPFYVGQKLPEDNAQLSSLYQQVFSKRKALLLLDNAADVTQVRPLIPPAPSSAIITSRPHFTLSEFDLHPLRLDTLTPEQSRDFLHTAAPELVKVPDNDVDALAFLCGRLPLALRVAAALLNDRDDWTITTLLKRLEEERTRLQVLKREKDLDVEATLNLSYELLGDLQKNFRYLGVFPAPFVEISAASVWGMDDSNAADDVLGKLVNRSLVNFVPLAQGEGGLYNLHDLTRLYAVERLQENKDETEEVVTRYAWHFLNWASYTNTEYLKGGEHILDGLNQFRMIWPHLFFAWERMLPEENNWPRTQFADEWLNQFPKECIYVLSLYLPSRQKIPILESALDASRRLADKRLEGVHLGNLGSVYTDLGDVRKAIEFLEKRLEIAYDIGDRQGEGNALGNLGNAYVIQGDPRKAIEFFEQALAIDHEIGDRRGEGADLGNLGNAYADLGNVPKAIEYYEKRIGIARELGDSEAETKALGNLGLIYTDLGDARKGIDYQEKALVISRKIGDRESEAENLVNLGIAYAKLSDVRKAIEYLEHALVILGEIGDLRGEAHAFGNLGVAYKILGDPRKAIGSYDRAIAISRKIGDRRGEAMGNWNLGLAYEKEGEIDKAINAMNILVAYEQEINHPDTEKHAAFVKELRKKQK